MVFGAGRKTHGSGPVKTQEEPRSMPRRILVSLVAIVVTWLAAPAVPATAAPAAMAAPPAATRAVVLPAALPVSTPDGPDSGVEGNPFIPEDRDLTDCISAVPKPGCGSKERGGWRQTLVFGVMVAGLAVIGWQVVRTVRRNRRLVEGADEQEPVGHRGP